MTTTTETEMAISNASEVRPDPGLRGSVEAVDEAKAIAGAAQGRTVASLFADRVGRNGDRVALRWKDGDEWATATWDDWADQACRVAAGLTALGVGHGDRVVLMMRNSPQFHVADVAVLLCGATPVSIYNSSSPDQIAYLAGHCRAAVAVVDDAEMLSRFARVRDQLPGLTSIVVVDGEPDGAAGLTTWAALLDHQPVDLAQASTRARPQDLATVIYTSGTTGPPKGVMLTHEGVSWTLESYVRLVGEIDGLRTLSYLPMAHVAERMSSHYLAFLSGFEITSCPDPARLAEYLVGTRPQTLFGVPRVWEKLYAGVRAALAADPEKQAGFEMALVAGRQLEELRRSGEQLSAEQEATAAQLEEKAFGPVKALLGLQELQFAVTGAAPIPVEVLTWFRAIGVPMSEIYGMSESNGPISWDPFEVRPGTVGRSFPGVELKLAEDGELCFRGGNAFAGYLDDPERTDEALDAEGWVHTGDVAVFDEAGYVKVVDRKKELIITAGGKNISPANLEAALKTIPLVGQAAVIGDARKFVSALLVLDPEVAPAWARAQGIEKTDVASLATDPVVLAEIEKGVEQSMSVFNNAEKVKRFTVLATEWLPDSDELTPTMKLKRRGVSARYADEIEAMYR